MKQDRPSDYTVVTSTNITKFKEVVNMKIRKGWYPQGGIATIRNDVGPNTYWTFNQAMVKYD